MRRSVTHTEDRLLDSARSVVVRRGARAATVAAVTAASGAPTGSLYHRFASIDEMLARAWIRAARRSQERALAVDGGDPRRTVVAAAIALYDFCLDNREDALLLGAFRRADFVDAKLPPGVRDELEHLNEPVAERLGEWARALFGRADEAAIELLLIALVDLPYGLARRYLDGVAHPPASHRRRLEVAVRTLIEERPDADTTP